MSATPLPLLGRIAVQLKFITNDQLAAATRKQAELGGTQNIGAVLCEMGFLSQPQLAQVLKARDQLVAKQRAMQAVAKADATPEVAESAPRSASPAPPPEHLQRVAPRSFAAAMGGVDPRELHALLQVGVDRGASDVHIHAGQPLRLRLHGKFVAANDEVIDAVRSEKLVFSALTADQTKLFRDRGELDLAYEAAGIGRFRVNLYRQQRGYDGVFRVIPSEIPTLDGLGLPQTLARFTNFHQGLVLVTGPANCGKSSTLAALVSLINEERREHILTVEDPIEFVHTPKMCAVNQRNVGAHTDSFARALRAALREDPDVIVIGELRDLETISLALTAAETGHLVLGTLHTNSAIRTINRLVGVFPADQQDQIRNMVSESLRAVISQRLVPTKDGSRRAPALEVLVNNKAVGNLIRENKTFQLFSIMQMGAGQGMALLDDSLNKLLASGEISREEALRNADDPKRIKG
jgi:twitching motility protein PilT